MGLRAYARDYARRTGFPIFVGVEYFSLQGDITAWGIESCPQVRIPAQDFIDQVNAEGGFCVACHPFRNNNRGLEENLKVVRGLHGIEVLNGSTSIEANRRAMRYCRELGCKPVGASDAHVEDKIGVYATWLPEYVDNLSDFVRQLRTCPTKAARWTGRSYEVLEDF